jgi:hypothetical protein
MAADRVRIRTTTRINDKETAMDTATAMVIRRA